MHSQQFDHFGNIDGSFSYHVSEFRVRLGSVVNDLVRKYFLSEPKIVGTLEAVQNEISSLPTPESGTFVMLDMDERKFIAGDNHIFCVDTEGYAIGPCEFDLIALEYSLDERTADCFARGYNSVRPLPKLGSVRTAYRFLARLMEIKGPVDLDVWMDHPHLLP